MTSDTSTSEDVLRERLRIEEEGEDYPLMAQLIPFGLGQPSEKFASYAHGVIGFIYSHYGVDSEEDYLSILKHVVTCFGIGLELARSSTLRRVEFDLLFQNLQTFHRLSTKLPIIISVREDAQAPIEEHRAELLRLAKAVGQEVKGHVHCLVRTLHI